MLQLLSSKIQSEMFFLATVSSESLADAVKHQHIIRDCASLLRKSFQSVDFGLDDRFCDANDLEAAWDNIEIPVPVLDFLAVLFNFNVSNFSKKSPYDEDLDSSDEESESRQKEQNSMFNLSKLKITAVFQIMFYILNNGRKKTPLQF
jgi:hypothetical protein